jgi:acyl-CoA synthetase (AMP-forming)/AMP-acid ligase II
VVCIRGLASSDGYAGNPGRRAAAFRDGWFLPGDLGKLTADGDLIYYGRADHMMIMNGMNLYPAEIERVLAAHPAVRDVAVVPLRHRVHQDLPFAAVVLKPGAQSSEAELMAHARDRLGVRAPRRILILERIPRTGEGKLIARELFCIAAVFLAGRLRARGRRCYAVLIILILLPILVIISPWPMRVRLLP